jgi:hypothetical protein
MKISPLIVRTRAGPLCKHRTRLPLQRLHKYFIVPTAPFPAPESIGPSVSFPRSNPPRFPPPFSGPESNRPSAPFRLPNPSVPPPLFAARNLPPLPAQGDPGQTRQFPHQAVPATIGNSRTGNLSRKAKIRQLWISNSRIFVQ